MGYLRFRKGNIATPTHLELFLELVISRTNTIVASTNPNAKIQFQLSKWNGAAYETFTPNKQVPANDIQYQGNSRVRIKALFTYAEIEELNNTARIVLKGGTGGDLTFDVEQRDVITTATRNFFTTSTPATLIRKLGTAAQVQNDGGNIDLELTHTWNLDAYDVYVVGITSPNVPQAGLGVKVGASRFDHSFTSANDATENTELEITFGAKTPGFEDTQDLATELTDDPIIPPDPQNPMVDPNLVITLTDHSFTLPAGVATITITYSNLPPVNLISHLRVYHQKSSDSGNQNYDRLRYQDQEPKNGTSLEYDSFGLDRWNRWYVQLTYVDGTVIKSATWEKFVNRLGQIQDSGPTTPTIPRGSSIEVVSITQTTITLDIVFEARPLDDEVILNQTVDGTTTPIDIPFNGIGLKHRHIHTGLAAGTTVTYLPKVADSEDSGTYTYVDGTPRTVTTLSAPTTNPPVDEDQLRAAKGYRSPYLDSTREGLVERMPPESRIRVAEQIAVLEALHQADSPSDLISESDAMTGKRTHSVFITKAQQSEDRIEVIESTDVGKVPDIDEGYNTASELVIGS